MTGSYEIGEYGGRQSLIVKQWSEECEEVLKREQMLVVFNQARGWKPRSMSFLAGHQIEELAILAHVPIGGLDAVVHIRNLRTLSLACEAKSAVRLDQVEGLKECWLSWSKQYESVFQTTSLRKLGVSDYPFEDLSRLTGLINLEELAIKGGKLCSLAGVKVVSHSLNALELCGLSQLRQLDELDDLRKIEQLRIDGCKGITTIEPLRHLSNLRSLVLSDLGEIDSLKPVQQLHHLEELVFAESTNVLDGDLSFLESLPNLRDVVFQPRRHYSHTNFLGLTRLFRKPWKAHRC